MEGKHNLEKSLLKYKFPLIQEKSEMKREDNFKMIFILLFITSFFDFFQFILSTYYINKIPKISSTLEMRLGGTLIIVSSLLYWYFLKFQLFRHQIFSLIIFGICVLLLIISEYFFQEFNGIIIIYTIFNIQSYFKFIS